MPKPSNREKLLTEGLSVVHARGFAGASVRDIAQAAGVPQGSFTNHFPSKEAFGLAVVGLYGDRMGAVARHTLGNPALAPLARIAAYLDAATAPDDAAETRHGCMLGNFAAECGGAGDAIRERVTGLLDTLAQALAATLAEAVAAGSLPAGYPCAQAATTIVAGLQGAMLLAKVRRDAAPLRDFKQMLFTRLLR